MFMKAECDHLLPAMTLKTSLPKERNRKLGFANYTTNLMSFFLHRQSSTAILRVKVHVISMTLFLSKSTLPVHQFTIIYIYHYFTLCITNIIQSTRKIYLYMYLETRSKTKCFIPNLHNPNKLYSNNYVII